MTEVSEHETGGGEGQRGYLIATIEEMTRNPFVGDMRARELAWAGNFVDLVLGLGPSLGGPLERTTSNGEDDGIVVEGPDGGRGTLEGNLGS